MILEAVIWTTIALAAPPITGLAMQRWGIHPTERLQPVVSLGERFRSLGIPYLALITGAITARDAGLSGQTWAEWLRGALECAAVLAIVWIAVELRRWAPSFPDPGPTVMDESRWALYRATGSLLADPGWPGPLIGLGVGVIEWAVVHRLWVQRDQMGAESWSSLVRLCASTILFLLTRNLWLIVLTQVGLNLMIRRRVHEADGDKG
jgi:hypothetical protein